MTELFSTESEVAVLSIILKNPDKLYETFSLKREHFSSIPNQILFETILQIQADGASCDKSVLIERLTKQGKLELVGEEFVRYLFDREDNVNNYREYEKNIIDSFIGKNLLSLGPKISSMLGNHEDVNKVHNSVLTELTNLLTNTNSNQTFTFDELSHEFWKDFKYRRDNNVNRGISTGYKDIDVFTGGIEPGHLWIIASRPSMGKTSMLVGSAKNAAEMYGTKSLIISREMSWLSLFERLVSMDTGIPHMRVRNTSVNEDEALAIHSSLEKLDKLPILIDQNFSGGLDYVVSTIRKYKHKENIQTVYVDYIGLLTERGNDETKELGRISKTLKLLAEELKLGIYVASQLNREVEFRDDKRPILSDLRQSGNLEEDADLVAFLYRDVYYNRDTANPDILEFIIRKNRHGAIGFIPMRFDKTTTKITGA